MNNTESVMQTAHIATRAMMAENGGRHSDYFPRCLKEAHAENKRGNEMVVTFEFASLGTLIVSLFSLVAISAIVGGILLKSDMLMVGWGFLWTMAALVLVVAYNFIKTSSYTIPRHNAEEGGFGTVVWTV